MTTDFKIDITSEILGIMTSIKDQAGGFAGVPLDANDFVRAQGQLDMLKSIIIRSDTKDPLISEINEAKSYLKIWAENVELEKVAIENHGEVFKSIANHNKSAQSYAW